MKSWSVRFTKTMKYIFIYQVLVLMQEKPTSAELNVTWLLPALGATKTR